MVQSPKDSLSFLFSERNVTTLWLYGNNHLVGFDVAQLVPISHFSKLTCLDLPHNDIGDEEVLQLARSPYMRNLTDLDLSLNRIEMPRFFYCQVFIFRKSYEIDSELQLGNTR